MKVLDPAVVTAFQRDGFVRAEGLLDPAEVTRFRVHVDRAVAWRTRNDPRGLDEKTPFEQSFTMCQYLWEDHPEIAPLTFHPRVAGAAAELIGAPRVRLWHDQALYKEPGGRETDAHQDQPYWPIAETDTLTAWIPLVEVDESIGCMGYVPGSHPVGLRASSTSSSADGGEFARPSSAARSRSSSRRSAATCCSTTALTVHLREPEPLRRRCAACTPRSTSATAARAAKAGSHHSSTATASASAP